MHVQSLDDIVRPYLHFPAAIQRALIRVETHPTFRCITKASNKVLKALVKRASATNGTAIIRARLDRVADETGVSYKTVQRAMRVLSQLGWVMPASEGRSEYGVYESKRYVLSPALCELVHLPTKDKPVPLVDDLSPSVVWAFDTVCADDAQEVNDSQGTEMSDGPIVVDLSFKKDLQEISIKNRNGEPPVLPASVSHVPEETGMSPTGVCKLLGIARKEGHQLEHVYAVAKPYLAKIGTNAARSYRYLLAMLTNPKKINYASQAAQQQRIAEVDPMKAIALQCRYKRFVHVSNGMRVRFFDGTAEVLWNGVMETYVGAQMLGLYRGVIKGNLREVAD